MGTHRRPKFYMSDRVEVFVCGGTGLVGSALVTQLRANAASRANIKLVGFCSSTKIIACEGEQKESVVRESADRRVPSDDEIMQCCSSPNATVCVVDATSSEDVSALYAPWLERRWHVVTCNKKVNSGNLEYYTRCMDATKNGGGKWFVEATIGAGLPIVSTLRTLVATGDEIESVQGIFSGTMSFLFNTWDGESAFSETVALAKAAGYTELDPREDLNGLDVARKVVIAARECGVALSLDDVVCNQWYPPSLRRAPRMNFSNGTLKMTRRWLRPRRTLRRKDAFFASSVTSTSRRARHQFVSWNSPRRIPSLRFRALIIFSKSKRRVTVPREDRPR